MYIVRIRFCAVIDKNIYYYYYIIKKKKKRVFFHIFFLNFQRTYCCNNTHVRALDVRRPILYCLRADDSTGRELCRGGVGGRVTADDDARAIPSFRLESRRSSNDAYYS